MWPNGWMDQDGTYHRGGAWSRPHCAKWGPSSPPQKREESSPHFSAHVLKPNGWKNQDATWYGGSPRPRPHCAKWGPSSPRAKKGHSPPPILGPCLLWPNGWIDEDATWYECRSEFRPHCVRRGPSSPIKGAQQPPLFLAHVYCGHGCPSQLLLISYFCIVVQCCK